MLIGVRQHTLTARRGGTIVLHLFAQLQAHMGMTDGLSMPRCDLPDVNYDSDVDIGPRPGLTIVFGLRKMRE